MATETSNTALDATFAGDEKPTHYRDFAAAITPGHDPNGPDVVATITCDTVDADNEVVLPQGADLSRYLKAPRVMLCHAYGKPGEYYPLPIGKALWTKRQGRALIQGVRFARSSAMGREVQGLFEEGMLNTFSIGFVSVEASRPTTQEKLIRPEWKDVNLIHRRWKLLEVSVVPIPCNEDAVGVYLRKGGRLPAFLGLPFRFKKADAMDGTIGAGPSEITEGLHVRIHPAHGGGCGDVVSVHKSGRVPDVDDDVVATEEKPAARVRLHDDDHQPTDKHRGIACSHLSVIDGQGSYASPYAASGKAVAESSGSSGGYAVAMSEHEPPTKTDDEATDSDDAETESIGPGHFVKWSKASGSQGGCGKVVSVHKAGKVPGVENFLLASEEEPAARVKVYQSDDDSHHYVETDRHLGLKVKHLTRLDTLANIPGRKRTTVASDERGVGFLFREGMLTKRAVPYESGPIVDGRWDAGAARARLRAWADDDLRRYRKGFAWFDASKPEEYGSYKFPHHDVRGGRLVVVKEGVLAALGALAGARGGSDIPETDRAAVKAHLERHRREFDQADSEVPKTVPPFRTRAQVIASIERRVRERLNAEAIAIKAAEQARNKILGVV